MFTGLIEAVCKIKSARQTGDSLKLIVDLASLNAPQQEIKIGDSIAINGCCLTVTKLDGAAATFDISPETLSKTIADKYKPSSQVNIERALKASDRLDGHLVTGHIDGTATITLIENKNGFADIRFAAPAELLDQMITKGSIAVDGISLTIASMDSKSFTVATIPETMKKTTLKSAKIGDYVNIETDMIVKTIKKQLENILPAKDNLTVEKLKKLGF